MAIKFIKGLELNKGFYFDVVKPIIDDNFVDLKYSAGLIGYGSDVLGFDTHISMDHNWGPRLIIFLEDNCFLKFKDEINKLFQDKLPVEYQGFSTNYTDKGSDFTQRMISVENRPINHLIEITTVRTFIMNTIGFDIDSKLTIYDWLSFPEQGLIEITEGKIFYDSIGDVTYFRSEFMKFPVDIKRIKIASLWKLISNEVAFVGRSIDNNDELGSRLIASRIVNIMMKICFYLEDKYIPYSKWFGVAFGKLSISSDVSPVFHKILAVEEIEKIEEYLCVAYKKLLDYQNAKGLCEFIDLDIEYYYGRPYKVIFADKIIEALINAIEDDELRQFNYELVGIEQKIDGMDFTNNKEILKLIALK